MEAELARLADALAAAETGLVEARVRLDRFTLAHDRLLGPLYADLDAVEARIAGLLARAGDPDDEAAARRARDRARQSAAAAEEVGEEVAAEVGEEVAAEVGEEAGAIDDLESETGPASDEVRRVLVLQDLAGEVRARIRRRRAVLDGLEATHA